MMIKTVLEMYVTLMLTSIMMGSNRTVITALALPIAINLTQMVMEKVTPVMMMMMMMPSMTTLIIAHWLAIHHSVMSMVSYTSS